MPGTPHKMLYVSTFTGTSGTSIGSFTPDHNDGTSPAFTVAGGSDTLDGSGNAVTAASSTIVMTTPLAGTGAFDWTFPFSSLTAGHNLSFYLVHPNSANDYQYLLSFNSGATNKATYKNDQSGTTLASSTSYTFPAGANTLTISHRPKTDGTMDFVIAVGGTTILSGNDPSPVSSTGDIAGLFVDFTGGAKLSGLTVANAPATSFTITAPSGSVAVGTVSGNGTIILDQPAGTGGQVINLTSDAGGTFRATSTGAAVTSVTVPDGSTAVFFYFVPAAVTSHITGTSTGLTAPSAVTYTATAPASTSAITVTGPSTLNEGQTSTYTATPNAAAPTGGLVFTPALGGFSGMINPTTLTFTAGSSAALTFTVNPTTGTNSGTVGGSGTGVTVTAQSVVVPIPTLTLSIGTIAVGNGVQVSVVPTLSNASGILSASGSGSLVPSTNNPTSGIAFTTTTPANGTGSGTITVTGPGGTTATATISYGPVVTWQTEMTFSSPPSGTPTVEVSSVVVGGTKTLVIGPTASGVIQTSPTSYIYPFTAAPALNLEATWLAPGATNGIIDTPTTGAPTVAQIVAGINAAGVVLAANGLDGIQVENNVNARQTLAISLAANSGKVMGAGTSNIQFKAPDGTTNRIVAQCDGFGNRTNVNLYLPT